jgi:hypothetical protein
MNHGFFSMTWKLSVNPCTGRVPGHQGRKKKHGRARHFQSNDDRFFDIQGTVHINWAPEGQTVNQLYHKVLTTLHE